KLHMRQPPLTQRIRDMERDLGIDLFRRIGNKVELTDAGKMVLNAARETLAKAESVCELAQRAARGACGKVTVGLPLAALLHLSIKRGVRVFQQGRPAAAVDLTPISSGTALDGLRQPKLDACLMRPFPSPFPPEFEESLIARDRLMLVVPAGHPR